MNLSHSIHLFITIISILKYLCTCLNILYLFICLLTYLQIYLFIYEIICLSLPAKVLILENRREYFYLFIYLSLNLYIYLSTSLKLEGMSPRSLMCPRWRFIYLSLFLKFTYPSVYLSIYTFLGVSP